MQFVFRPRLCRVLSLRHFIEDGLGCNFGGAHVQRDVDAVVADEFCILEDFGFWGAGVGLAYAEAFAEEV